MHKTNAIGMKMGARHFSQEILIYITLGVE